MIKLKSLILEDNEPVPEPTHITSNRNGVSVGLIPKVIVNISYQEWDGGWYVNRVLISDVNLRNKGIGSKFLQIAIKKVLERNPDGKIIVEPGGYGSNIEDQMRFYKKNGFVDIPDQPGVLIYGGNQQIKEDSAQSPTGPPANVIQIAERIKRFVKGRYPDANLDRFVKIVGPVPNSDVKDVSWNIINPQREMSYAGFFIGYYIRQRKWKWFYTEYGTIEDEGFIVESNFDNIIEWWLR